MHLRNDTLFILITISLGLYLTAPVDGKEATRYPNIGAWKPIRDSQVFTKQNLFDYIDGASELYLSYEFRQLDVVYYKNPDQQEITVEVYRHASPLFAFGIYSQERAVDANYLTIGSEAYQEGYYLFALAGPYYVKIYSYDLGDQVDDQLAAFARDFIAALDAEQALPELVSAFPKDRLQAKSIQFVARNFLGYSFFEHGYQAFYDIDNEKCRLFIIATESIKESKELLDKYLLHIRNVSQISRDSQYEINDPYHGTGIIRTCQRFIYGGFGAADIQQLAKILDQVRDNICR